jgi:hypothetical protein
LWSLQTPDSVSECVLSWMPLLRDVSRGRSCAWFSYAEKCVVTGISVLAMRQGIGGVSACLDLSIRIVLHGHLGVRLASMVSGGFRSKSVQVVCAGPVLFAGSFDEKE